MIIRFRTVFWLTMQGRGRPKADDMAGSVYVAEDHMHKNPEPRVGLLRALRE